MIKLNKAIVVEGKYDKIKLANIIDAVIVTTDGFGIFKNREKLDYIRLLARETGIIILTDSDSAGQVIRSYLKGAVPDADIVNVYVPQIEGKEKRKSERSAEGFLGVEGVDDETIVAALRQYGVLSETVPAAEPLTKSDLFSLGLYGTDDSSELRKKLFAEMKLPSGFTVNNFLEYVNKLDKIKDFEEAYEKCRYRDKK